MQVVHECCAGLDVHKKSIVACVRRVAAGGRASSEVRTFGAMTADLLALADWLDARGVRQVAMESTGVYWKPVFHVLEGRFEVMLVNAGRLKQVPGRKTDVKDSEWIAQLLQHGLLSPSFIPGPEVREVRELTRQRTELVRDRAAVANRIQKALEDANVKLGSVASDVLGASGRAMIRAMIDGQDDPDRLAELARRKLRGKIPELRRALAGRVTDHHRFVLKLLMDQVEALEALIRRLDERIDEAVRPFHDAAARLRGIPGVGERAAEVILGEVGPDVEAFATAARLCSWAGLCPGNDQSAGKRRSGRTTKGSQWLRSLLVQAAWTAGRMKGTTFHACYQRWAKRLGRKKALVAVAHKLLVVIWHVLKDGTTYRERHQPAPAA